MNGSQLIGLPYFDFFRARITGKHRSTGDLFPGRWMYDWIEQSQNQSTGVSEDANPARSGSYEDGTEPTYLSPAVELNDAEISDDAIADGVYVYMRQRSNVQGWLFYEFSVGGVSGGSNVEMIEIESAPALDGLQLATVLVWNMATGEYDPSVVCYFYEPNENPPPIGWRLLGTLVGVTAVEDGDPVYAGNYDGPGIEIAAIEGPMDPTGEGGGYQPARLLDKVTLSPTTYIWVREINGSEIPVGTRVFVSPTGIDETGTGVTAPKPIYNGYLGVWEEVEVVTNVVCVGNTIEQTTGILRGLFLTIEV